MPTFQTAVTKSWNTHFSAFLISLLLTGCLSGGGGGAGGGTTTDTAAPTVSSTSPASNATGVATSTAVSATFSEAMNAASITTSTFTLKTTSGAAAVSGTVALSGNTATFTPAAALAYGTNYTATLTTGVQDSAGNAFAAASTWMFTTVVAPDTTAPTVTGNYPADAASSVATNTSISVTFSEAMATSLTTNVAIFTVSGGVTGTVNLSGNTATFTPSTVLSAGSHTATITTAAQDLAGNALATNHSWSFTVGATSDSTPPTVNSNTPADLASNVAVAAAVTATFSEAMKASTIASSFTLAIAGGAAVSGTATLSADGLVATFPHAALTGQTDYTATISTGAQDAAGNPLAVAKTWTFTTLDNTPPTVTTKTPASGAVSVGVNTTITATFSEAMDLTSLQSSFTVSGGVTGMVTLSGNTATFTPSTNLTGSTTYTATITTGAQDTAGNALAQQQWSFMTAAVPTFTISGTVTGPYVEGVTITMSGGATDTAVTNAMGVYSFATSRPAGSYTLTPSLAGYTYSPSAPSVAVSANTTQGFTASSAIASYSISGTVSYVGSKIGRTRVQVFYASCTNCSPVAGISIASPGTGAYTIRGVPPGSYVVKASTGYLGTGAANATNPSGVTSTVTVGPTNQTGANITLTDPAAQTATTPTGLMAASGKGAVLLLWDPVYNANNTERVTAYKIYWGTDTLATNGTPIIVGARDDALYIQSGLTDGSSLYYKIASCVSGDLLCTTGEGTASAVVGPVTIGATTGLNTVSGTVTLPVTATGPLVVGVYENATGSVYFTTIATPTSSSSYSISGVTSGTYSSFAIVDMNSNGMIDIGDLSNTNGTAPLITVNGPTTSNLTLSSASANATVGTRFFSDGTNPAGYSLQMEVDEGTKRPVNVTLVSGANVAVPLDMGKDWEFSAYSWLNTTAPMVGDTYVFKVTFSDGTTETLSRSVSAVFGLDSLPQTLGVTTNGMGGSSATVPLFTWAVPTSAPTAYVYDVYVSATTGGTVWNTDGGLPSTTLSVLYNADGNASSPSLTSGTTYNWQVTVEDANGNQATKQTTYVVP